jgi:parallel beta-helix repeat protein
MNGKAVSGIVMILLLVGILTPAFNIQAAKASGTIYIKPDGAINPPTAPILRDRDTYTLTDDIYESIIVEKDNIVIDGANYTVLGAGASLYSRGIDLAGRKNVTLRNMSIEGFYYGVYLDFSSSNSIFGNNMTNNEYGIRLDDSLNNSISRNDITANNEGGVWVFYSTFNSISRNNVTANSWEGILLIDSSYNIISENKAINNADGIILADSSFNSVSGNNITANTVGIPIVSSSRDIFSSGNIIFGNDLAANADGILLHGSLGNFIHHNNFLNNTRQVYDVAWTHPVIPPSINSWDDGYPSGGNYWSDYEDSYPDAKEQDDSGIWDMSYFIDENNQDNYPLIDPRGSIDGTINALIRTVRSWELHKGIENSLTSKLDSAIHLLSKGNGNGAIHKLLDFINQVEAQRGKKMTGEQADYLVAEAQKIIDLFKV